MGKLWILITNLNLTNIATLINEIMHKMQYQILRDKL